MSVAVESSLGAPSFFDGVPPDAAAEILGQLEARRFPAGTVVVAEGDSPRLIYLAESGTAEVVVGGRRVGSVQAGTTVGEMSFFTGEPASATVRAVDDFVAYTLNERDLERLASSYPQVYRNLAAIISNRLARTNRLAARKESGRLVLVRGGPPLHAYALACSLAWHAREPTVLLVAGEAPELERFVEGNHASAARAKVILERSGSDGGIAALLDHLADSHAHVLVLAPRATPPALEGTRTVELPAGIELVDDDHAALQIGLLPNGTAAGRTLGRLARQVGGLTLGLAFGAGSLRGYAHIGVIRGLAREGIEADVVAGTSIGASVAAGYAMQLDAKEIERIFQESAKTIFKPRVPIKGFLSSAPLGRFLRGECQGKLIEELPLPLGIVAADLITRREVVFRSGVLWRAVLASMSVPGVFPAQRMGDLTLVDGGVVNAVPSSVACDMGAATVIAVRLLSLPDISDMESESFEESSGRPPSALRVILRSFDIMMAHTSRESTAATITITPQLPKLASGSKLRNWAEGGRFVEAGEAALEAALPRIRSLMPWMQAPSGLTQ